MSSFVLAPGSRAFLWLAVLGIAIDLLFVYSAYKGGELQGKQATPESLGKLRLELTRSQAALDREAFPIKQKAETTVVDAVSKAQANGLAVMHFGSLESTEKLEGAAYPVIIADIETKGDPSAWPGYLDSIRKTPEGNVLLSNFDGRFLEGSWVLKFRMQVFVEPR